MLVIPLSPSLDAWIVEDVLVQGPHRAVAVAYPTPTTLEKLDALDAKILVVTKGRPFWYDEFDVCFDPGEAFRIAAIRCENQTKDP